MPPPNFGDDDETGENKKLLFLLVVVVVVLALLLFLAAIATQLLTPTPSLAAVAAVPCFCFFLMIALGVLAGVLVMVILRLSLPPLNPSIGIDADDVVGTVVVGPLRWM